MRKTEVTVKLKKGFHTRPISRFINKAKEFDSHIELEYNGRKANARSILSVLALGVPFGGKMVITAEGSDEEKAIEKLMEFFENPDED